MNWVSTQKMVQYSRQRKPGIQSMEVGTGLAHPMSPKGLRIVRGWEVRGTGSEMNEQ